MASRIEQIIEEIEEYIDNCKYQALSSSKIIVNKEEMEELLNELRSKTPEEIFYQDYKHFTAEGFTFGAGQVLAANEDDVQLVKDRMVPYLETALAGEGIDLVCLMITNVTDESTDLIFTGSNAKAFIESAFGKKTDGNCIHLEGVVSRKKQLIPPMMAVLNK